MQEYSTLELNARVLGHTLQVEQESVQRISRLFDKGILILCTSTINIEEGNFILHDSITNSSKKVGFDDLVSIVKADTEEDLILSYIDRLEKAVTISDSAREYMEENFQCIFSLQKFVKLIMTLVSDCELYIEFVIGDEGKPLILVTIRVLNSSFELKEEDALKLELYKWVSIQPESFQELLALEIF